MPQLDDAWLATGPRGERLADLGEQLGGDGLVLEPALDQTAGVQVAAARERDEPLRERTQLLRLRLGRIDTAVLKEARGHVVQRRLFMTRRTRELTALGAVPHLLFLGPGQLGLRRHALIDHANVAAGRLLALHAEVQA